LLAFFVNLFGLNSGFPERKASIGIRSTLSEGEVPADLGLDKSAGGTVLLEELLVGLLGLGFTRII
jgi:hypothetical protein